MSLKLLLETNENARKIFGKKEIGIIIRQLEGKKLTQSEKNRLSRDIRPKLNFIKEISKFEPEFGLRKNQENKKIIDKAVRAILSDELKGNIKAVLLFGSFAGNTFTSRSDIDICAVFRKNISLKEATKFRIRVSSQLPEKIDVQVFSILPQKIKREIAKNHKVLFKAEDYDNVSFTISFIKDNDFFIRKSKIYIWNYLNEKKN